MATTATGLVGAGLPALADPTAEELITPQARAAIDRGLAHLARLQVSRGSNRGAFGSSGLDISVAVAGLAGIAFMCGGSTPGIGRYGTQVKRCVDYVMGQQRPSGYLGGSHHQGNMYGHGFATLFLGLAHGMAPQLQLHEKLRKAVKLIIDAQNSAGGWRYQPAPTDADLSITVCQIMALRAAREAGIHVPENVRNRCIQYVQRSQGADGGFQYTVGSGYATFACTAAALVSLYSAGIYEGQAIERGLDYLENNRNSSSSYYFYANYYAVQAMWHAGGDRWQKWYPRIRDELISSQLPTGGWNSSRSEAFGTAMALIVLQMPKDIVPVFAK